jgi:hypothetical protein
MREALNSNPLVQVGVVAVLAVLVGFMLLTRMSGGGGEETTETPVAETTKPGASVETTETEGLSETTIELEGEAATEAVEDIAGQASGVDSFSAGPGLPKKVVAAYKQGDTVALLITKHEAMEDKAMREVVTALRKEGNGLPENTTVFSATAKHIADYSRIARGVDVDRVPALIVLTPRKLNDGGLPTASISYGVNGRQSIIQAFNDAGYDGKDLPYHPK